MHLPSGKDELVSHASCKCMHVVMLIGFYGNLFSCDLGAAAY